MENFVWETHGIHTGTGSDHVKHGIDDIENVVRIAIEKGYPSVTFIIHTPRLTGFRYQGERNTDIKFIRGDNAYFNYGKNINALKKKYKNKITIKHGIELEWQGSDIGLAWNRSKTFQADGIDFVIGSIHFSKEKIAYDGSKEETEKLIEKRGGLENYWLGYLDEMVEMLDATWDNIQVVGHLDLLKLYTPLPECFMDLDNSDEPVARKMRLVLEKISEYNLALDVNLAGIKRECGIYPHISILKRANTLGIPVTLGTDTHYIENLGKLYKEGIEYLKEAGYTHYLSFCHCIPEKRPLDSTPEKIKMYSLVNSAIELLNKRSVTHRNRIPNYSFGGAYTKLSTDFPNSVKGGTFDCVTVRKDDRSLTISPNHPEPNAVKKLGIYSSHRDQPGVLTILINALASEGINIETAELNSDGNGTAEAFLTFSGNSDDVKEALEFTKGTGQGLFHTLELKEMTGISEKNIEDLYLLEIDGVEIHTPVTKHMIITSHKNRSGVLLILLSALSSLDVNIETLQLGERGNRGYAVLGIEGDFDSIAHILPRLGPHFKEVSHIKLND
ncbi:histidinol-phosphatase HisJ family protein [Thiospirochaeta perfilievii]|uniref:histidinol-phosphatase n=1 Tax=Thiospirochaeta perfilievii TaxID=252967 RepID=A0A5C1Q7I0_9SPIO|nr:histidinol-phosphatase HisJ family protein [Thiospirochaeta perfilievii]QEN04033.1 histidinol-phosphatase HisJ family protein [Thiospirochaeta perfilievii]